MKLIPGLSNHVFFYGLSRRDDSDALRQLTRRAPELLGQFDSQLNTALYLGAGTPVSQVLDGAVATPAKAAYWPVAYDPASLEDSLARTLGGDPLSVLPPRASELAYVPLTQTSLGETGFLNWLSGRLLAHWRDPTRALVVRLPEAVAASDEIADRARSVLAALESVRARLPSAPAPNVWFADGDPAPEELRRSCPALEGVFPHSYDFWRQPPAWYRGFRSLTVRAPVELRLGENFEDLVMALTGLRPRLVRDSAPGEALS